jgi:carbonic anhydrase
MTGIESVLERNRAFAAAGGHEGAVVLPSLQLLVITCLDPRVDPAHVLGLELSDAIVVRNVGGRVTPEVIDDVAFIAEIGARLRSDGPLFEVAVIHHTQCGATLRDPAMSDPRATVAKDVETLRAAPQISPRVRISGYVYDVVTGLVS